MDKPNLFDDIGEIDDFDLGIFFRKESGQSVGSKRPVPKLSFFEKNPQKIHRISSVELTGGCGIFWALPTEKSGEKPWESQIRIFYSSR